MCVLHESGSAFPALEFVILAGGCELPGGFRQQAHLSHVQTLTVRSLHFIGELDTLVTPQQSEHLAQIFKAPQISFHQQAHCFPQQSNELEQAITFISGCTALYDKSPVPGAAAAAATTSGSSSSSVAAVAVAAAALPSPPLSSSLSSSSSQQSKTVAAAAATAASSSEPAIVSETQAQELEALQAIFADDFEIITRCPEVKFRIQIREFTPSTSEADNHGSGGSGSGSGGGAIPALVVVFPADYPQKPPGISTSGLRQALQLNRADENGVQTQLVKHLVNLATDELLGSEMVFQLVEAMKTWMEDWQEQRGASGDGGGNGGGLTGDGGGMNGDDGDDEGAAANDGVLAKMRGDPETDNCNHDQLCAQASADAAAYDASCPRFVDTTAKGQWRYVIGLVGKPSAGKSTFFNAASDPADESQAARVAAFPFTTILPNVGRAFFSAECAYHAFNLKSEHGRSDAAYGFDAYGWRRVPVVIKDVAGLVPGAYQGRGKGNAFLNDLCDAHVLIHVVDASGETDKEGNQIAAEDGKPAQDIDWVRAEVSVCVCVLYWSVCMWCIIIEKFAIGVCVCVCVCVMFEWSYTNTHIGVLLCENQQTHVMFLWCKSCS